MKCTFIVFSTIILAVRAIRCLSPIQELEPGATPSVVGVVLLAILADCQQPNNTNTLIMIMQDPAEGVEPSQRAVPDAG